MKKTTTMVAIFSIVLFSNAQNEATPLTSFSNTIATEEVKQEPVASSHGIDVYYTANSDLSGNTFLDIHFVNTSDETLTFDWLITKEGQTFRSSKSVSIKPGKSFDERSTFEVKGTTDLSEYAITLLIK
ncbi:MAG: hypothetical protein HWE22_19710 [Flavobacteriales bacterium]|nr:hypothetical protein [Flavobacteriales bacterium]